MLVGVDTGCGAGWDTGLPDSERADTHPCPRLGLFDRRIHLLDKAIDVTTTLRRCFSIWELLLWSAIRFDVRVGVKIVVDVDAIDIVAARHIEDDR